MSDRPLPRDDMPSAWGWDLIPKIYQKDEKESSDFNFEYEDSYYVEPIVETVKIVYDEYIPLQTDSDEDSPHDEY